MRRALLPAILFLLAGLVAVAPGGAAEALYYETTVVTDVPDDFPSPHNGALDIVAVHVVERYSVEVGGEVVQFRVELRNRDDIDQLLGNVDLQYTLGFKVNGQDVVTTTTMTQTCSPSAQQGISCTEPAVDAPHYTTSAAGVVFLFPRAASGMEAGGTISDVYAATATIGPDGATPAYQDVAPEDNAGAPAGQDLAPSEFGGPYTLEGTFPFFTMERTSAHHRPLVPGGSAEYKFLVTTHEQLNGLDRIILNIGTPAGWQVEANLGTDFIVSDGGQAIEMTLTVQAPPLALAGDAATIDIAATMIQLGGHFETSVAAEVTGPKVELPEYGFELATPGPFTEGELSTLQTSITKDGAPLVRYKVSYDFMTEGAKVATVRAEEVQDGLYQAAYVFPSGGDWTVDVYVSELQPSPHTSFDTSVSSGDSPAPGPLVLLLVAFVVVAARRRFD